ncbi:dnajc7, partial [Symbiodinium microadriaticum]
AVDKLFSEQKFDGIIHFAGLKVDQCVSATVAADSGVVKQVASSELLALSVSSSSPGQLDVLFGSAAVTAGAAGASQAWIVTVTELGGTSTEVDVMEECNETEACQMPAPSVCKMVSGMPPFYEGRTSLSLEWSSGGDGDCIFQSWEAEWRPFGGSWMLAENETGTSEILTGLQENAAYEFRVRQLCTDSSLNSAYADFPESLLTLPGIFSVFVGTSTDTRVIQLSYGPSRCRVLKQCCGDQFTVCHSGEARKTVTLSRMDVMGGWGQPLWLQCTAQSVADYTTFTEVQAPAPLWLQLHEATATTMKAKYRLGYIIDETATCDCATLSLELRADDSDVTTYDSSFSYRQDQVARLGDRARPETTEEDRRRFQASPFMQRMREIDEKAWQQFSERDKKRSQTDPSFSPKDTDFEAPKSFKYDKSVNYYKTLGVEEYATNDEIKKAYRKLSLNYHPDKQTNKTQEEKDEAAAIFMEIKNAYKLLADDPTRRQYDFERDRDNVSAQSHGKKPQEKNGFDAGEALQRMMQKAKENKKLPSEIITVPVHCRIEKFVFGGQKTLKRTRLVKDKSYGGFNEEVKTFRIDLPAGVEQPWSVDFRRQGDQHEGREADTIRFLFSAKPHLWLDRDGQDIKLREAIQLGSSMRSEAYLSASIAPFSRRQVFIWGRNPFHGSTAVAEEGQLAVQLQGLGLGPQGALALLLKLGMGTRPESRLHVPPGPPAGRRPFLERFGLAPSGGFGEPLPEPGAGSMLRTLLERRQCRREMHDKLTADIELRPIGQTIRLFTKPPSTLTFLASTAPKYELFAVSLDCPACGKKKASADWDRLKARLTTVLQETAFILLAQARSVQPRCLLAKPIFDDRIALSRADRPMPWKNMGDQAFKQGSYWIACAVYAKRLEELRIAVHLQADDAEEEACEEEVIDVSGQRGPDLVPEAAKVLSNRAACLIKVQDYLAAVAHARKAAALAPRWARAWSRLGQAAWELGDKFRAEAAQAYAKSVEMDPLPSTVQALQSSVSQLQGPNPDASHAAKEKGNEAIRSGQIGLGIALYTQGIAQLPAPTSEDRSNSDSKPDEHALLRGVLFTNRSAAFSRVRSWDAAVKDAKEAVAAQPGLSSAHSQLGVALLGSGFHQEAYVQFARGFQLDSEHKPSIKGRNTCLKEMVAWKSASATARYQNRFWLDLRRPKGSTRIFAISDLHFDQKCNEDWAHAIDDIAFLDDVLIVAGNVADTKVGMARALTTLKSKFRRVFYTVGNHEMQIATSEFARYPDSIAKLSEIFSTCDELGIDVFPAPVCEGVLVVPLLSWCSAEFDHEDPFPDPNSNFNRRCSWPMDPDLQVWKYMMKLNESFLSFQGYETVITFSHFLPRQGLPFDKTRKNAVKAVGCDMIDEQARALKSKLHVYGHGRVRYAQMHSGVRYVSPPIGFEADWPKDHPPRLMLVHTGKSLCMQEWGADDEPPLGYVKRLLNLSFYTMPGLRESELRKLQNTVQRHNSFTGIACSFDRLGSKNQDKEALAKDAFPDFAQLSKDATHAMITVADCLDNLKDLWKSDIFAKDWPAAIAPHARNTVSFTTPLGLDLVHAKKRDPMLIVYGLRLSEAVREDGDDYGKMQKAVEAINKLPGIDGKIAVSLHPTGFARFSHSELLEELGEKNDKSCGLTHCFTVLVDEPASYKMLAQSKTFGKWKSSYEPSLVGRGPNVMAFALPLDIAATASAPKPPKGTKGSNGFSKSKR